MIGIIGGTGVYNIIDNATDITRKTIDTPFGKSPEILIFAINSKKIAFITRHNSDHSIPPHKINYRANIWALKEIGVTQIIATNSVGSMDLNIKPGALVIPDDFIDFTSGRESTFFDETVEHVDICNPYCTRLREIILSNQDEIDCDLIDGGVYVCTNGPRFETPAEIKMFQKLGGTLAGMTGLPEAVLARELGMCYATICISSNYAAGISPTKITLEEVLEILETVGDPLLKLIYKTIDKINPTSDCECQHPF